MRDFKVNELIDSNNKLWKRELINNTFIEEDAGRILRIPLARIPHDDFLIWGENRWEILQKALDPKSTNKNKYYNLETLMELSAYKGIVVRDAEGKVLLSCSEIHHGITSPFAAEAIASQTAVQIGVEKGWQSIIIEGDSLAIVNKCKTKSQDRSLVGVYIYDIQQKINDSKNIIFKHTPRSANALAHLLTTETLKRKEEIYMEIKVLEYAENQKRIDWMREPD
ncbi:hypothetical protein CXB51_034154 [Gossypium anomalum]|uniref:RNase H type-1 domain-containing protein n=1 Tax=Gossypium anomalum TaxID=47600 RepID=A0A8J6CIX1_9ROSI|nr:hypothetical protein CXB51_034154 [Gossypium anomalum]